MRFFKPSLTIILLTILITVVLYPLTTAYVFALMLGDGASLGNQLFAKAYTIAIPAGSYLFFCACRFMAKKMKKQKREKR